MCTILKYIITRRVIHFRVFKFLVINLDYIFIFIYKVINAISYYIYRFHHTDH